MAVTSPPGGYPAPGGGNFPAAGSSGTGASGFSFSAISVPTRWALGGGIALFLGALLPFVSVHLSTNLFSGGFTASTGISGGARFASAIFGLILGGLGAAAQFGPASAGPKRAFKIILLALSALGILGYLGFTVLGIVGFNQTAGLGVSAHETYSPNVGLILSILGCAACIYAGIAFLRQPQAQPGQAQPGQFR